MKPIENHATTVDAPSKGETELSRADRLVEHIAHYGLTTRAIASRLFCDGSGSKTENLFAPLLKQGRIRAYSLRKSPRLSYYTLSRSEAARLARSPLRGRRAGRSIEEALAVLHYCHQPGTTRRRVSANAVQERLGAPLLTLLPAYVAEAEPEQYFGRIVIPGRESLFNYALSVITKEALDLDRFEAARVWLPEGAYRFVVLTLSRARRQKFLEDLARWQQSHSVLKKVRVDVAVVDDAVGSGRLLEGGKP